MSLRWETGGMENVSVSKKASGGKSSRLILSCPILNRRRVVYSIV